MVRWWGPWLTEAVNVCQLFFRADEHLGWRWLIWGGLNMGRWTRISFTKDCIENDSSALFHIDSNTISTTLGAIEFTVVIDSGKSITVAITVKIWHNI